jgi:trehalose 6-phosphate phosphatase
LDIDRFVEEFKANASRAGFVLDFDGTLSEVVRERDAASALPGVAELLEQLASKFRLVALLSGRRAEDLHQIVGARGPRYIGVYGGEEFMDGRLESLRDADRWRGMASRLARDAEALITAEGLAGVEVEFKDIAVSVHYRKAKDPDAESKIQSWAGGAAEKRGFRANVGRKVIEMAPAGVSKANAVDRIVQENGLEWVVAAGDDWTDVEAMIRAGDLLGGRALRIGVVSQEEPEGLRGASDLIAESPTEVLAFLERFL